MYGSEVEHLPKARQVPCLAQKGKQGEGSQVMAHQGMGVDGKPEDLSLIEIHMAEGKFCQLPSDLTDLHMCFVCPHTHTQAN